MGPLPETSQRNKHILVLVDHFTRWCEAFSTPYQKAITVAPLLRSRIFSRFDPSAVLHSDQGRNFESVLMHEICDSIGITKTRITAYHPQCDGQTERQNRTLQHMLTSFVSSRKDDWDLWLDSVTFAYNTSRHDVLGVSPYEVVFGRDPRLPLELVQCFVTLDQLQSSGSLKYPRNEPGTSKGQTLGDHFTRDKR